MLTYFRCVGGRIDQHAELTPGLPREPEGARHGIDLEEPTVKEATILEDPFPILLMRAVPTGLGFWFRKQGWL